MSGARTGSDGLVLAVDGGNFKTDLALLDPDGGLLALVRGGGSSAHYLGVEGCIEVLEHLLARAASQAGLGSLSHPFASSAQVLLAGADLAEERAALQARIEQLHWADRLLVDNDTLALLRAGTDRGWGVAVVCGAGINCLGLAPDGREVRFLSLGQISGDWGGGADLGLAALGAAARSADGRGPRTALETAVPAHFGLSGPLEVSRELHLRRLPEQRLAELAPVVLAASAEDPVAAAIIGHLAEEVIAFARAALCRLDLTGSDPDVVLGGGVLRAISTDVVQAIARGVEEVAPKASVVVSSTAPVVGAALLGLGDVAAAGTAGARARAELDAAVAALVRAAPPATDQRPLSPPRPAPR